MTSIWTSLNTWVRTLPYWEQIAFDKVLDGGILTESDYEELLQYLLEDHDLAPRGVLGQRPEPRFAQNTPAVAQPIQQSVRLVRVFNTQHVNALIPGQTITFGDGLTALFGANGSGKSGYARLLGCACFTRGDKEVLPDITQADNANCVASMDVEVVVSDGTSRVITVQYGRQCPELSSFYMFDSTSVGIHLTKSNKISFAPAGLSYITRLADVTDKVRACLQAKIIAHNQPNSFQPLFQGDSEVAHLIADLNHRTQLQVLRRLATLTAAEEQQQHEADIRLAQLKSQDVTQRIHDLNQTIDDLVALVQRLHTLVSVLDEQAFDDLYDVVRRFLTCQQIAQDVGIEQFRSDYFSYIGSDPWRQFIEAARNLAVVERPASDPYPQVEDRCLLCQQPLSDNERQLLLRLWNYLQADAQTQLAEAQDVLDTKRALLEALDLDFFNETAVAYRYLYEHYPKVLEQVVELVAVCRSRYQIAHHLLTTLVLDEPSSFSMMGITSVEEVIRTLRADRHSLEQQTPTQEMAKLQDQLTYFEHRVLLGKHLAAIEDYVQKRVWAHKASKVGGTTRHITQKYNELFTSLVTERYVQLFEQTLREMQRPLRVKIKAIYRKGEALKQIMLEVDPSVSSKIVEPQKVLSEGEKRAVALADFLTEVALDDTSSGIILDDPVTSLDFEWKSTIAQRLMQEAGRRQVIVFTHDLHFLSLLSRLATTDDTSMMTHWIERGVEDGRPGYVHLNNSPAAERDYKKVNVAEALYKRAKTAPPEERELLLKAGFGALRTTYEAFVVFELFGGVVTRFAERISIDRLKEVVFDEAILAEVIEKVGLLSRYIEGHLHSDEYVAQKPTPQMLFDEIEAFKTLQKRLKDLKSPKPKSLPVANSVKHQDSKHS